MRPASRVTILIFRQPRAHPEPASGVRRSHNNRPPRPSAKAAFRHPCHCMVMVEDHGARRCAHKIAEYVYRRDRDTRTAQITVTWLMKALGKPDARCSAT